MRIVISLNSVEELSYIAAVATSAGARLCIKKVTHKDGALHADLYIPEAEYDTLFLLGFTATRAKAMTLRGHNFGHSHIAGDEIENFGCSEEVDMESPHIGFDHAMTAYLNFEDEELVQPVIDLYKRRTHLKVEILSEESVPSGHIVHLKIASNDPMAMVTLGAVFGEEYERFFQS